MQLAIVRSIAYLPLEYGIALASTFEIMLAKITLHFLPPLTFPNTQAQAK
jgi:hypothetical protein